MSVKAHVKRRVRFLVLEALYEAETSNHEPMDIFERRLADVRDEDPSVAEPAPAEFGRAIVNGVTQRWREADGFIAEAAPKYAVNTLAVVDRNILRLAIWELLSDPSAPVAAVVNEGVELAHRYGGESSPAFINAVLRTVSRKIRGTEPLQAVGQAATPDPTQPGE